MRLPKYSGPLVGCLLLLFTFAFAQSKPEIRFLVTLDHPNQTFHVKMDITGLRSADSILLKMPAWTPGYYQLLHFADKVSDFIVHTKDDATIPYSRKGRNGWRFASTPGTLTIDYNVKATRSFVATPFLDQSRGYIAPTGVFMHVASLIHVPATVTLQIPDGWRAATGLKAISKNQFLASDFDVLYDSPILLGPLEELPGFDVKGIHHRFVAFKPGDFDRSLFMTDMKKIVTEAASMIGDIPYTDYTFLGIGPGQGGIEHLNSTTFGFSADGLKSREGRNRMYSFLAHEYFHHYNVKRIRPIELGPFDYDKENRTNMLWVSEGITVYYDLLLVRRAGLITDEELFDGLRRRLLGFENKPGRLYQSATQASYNTWSDGPFGRTEDEINKTVSVYDKGSIVGWLLDFKIREETKNKKSLDDVMRQLYNEFYLKKKRGFTEAEFWKVAEDIAGTKLDEVFDYTSTTKELDYKKYLGYGGIDIDTEPREVEGAWLGISTRIRNDSVFVTTVDYESPAWKAGVKRRMAILNVDNGSAASIHPIMTDKKEGDKLELEVLENGQVRKIAIELKKKVEPDFKVSRSLNRSAAQDAIFSDWVRSRASK